MKKIFPISILLFSLVLLGVGCGQKWEGFYYPNGCLSCEEDYIYSPIFSSLDDCRDWADSIRQSRGDNPTDQYECGLNCKKKDGFNVCKETTE